MGQFVHLHVHTEYSLLDGAGRIKQVIAQAQELGMSALAITDHGVMYGVVDFYKAAKKAGIKPILGCEVYVAPRSRQQKEARLDDNNYHLVLLAENEIGYRNLLHLVSVGYTEGFYYKPRVDKELLQQHSEGLIALSACLGGEIPSLIMQEQYEAAKATALSYQEIFGAENFFLELQDHRLEEQRQVNRYLVRMSRELGIPLVATNDVHYVSREDARVQDVLLCIQTGKTVDDGERMKFDSDDFYLKSYEEMQMLFGELPEALANTVRIAERCHVDLDFSQMHLPYYQVPEGHTLDSYLEHLCTEKARQRYGEITPPVQERLTYELEVIRGMGYSGYFLIVWDFVNYAREQGILVGPGRGSAAGSIVSYVLGITNIDPLKYQLLFERFLNPERVSMPDIDIDFCFERRGEVIDYVISKYGVDKVSQIITFGTMAARAAVRDVGRALNLSYGEVDRVAKLIPGELGMTIDKALQMSPDLKQLYDQEPRIKQLIDTANALEGMPRHASTHAAGVVIAKEPLTHYLPLYRTSDGVVTTQFAKETVEEIGLLKMDLLGLRTLTVIRDALNNVLKTTGQQIDIDHLPEDDVATFELLSRGEGIGVFQVESSGLRAIMKDLKPSSIDDITALVALYRPGPLGSGMVDDFIKGKHGGAGAKTLHPILEPILRDTYGVILYQEQVMRIASDLAGFSLGEADLLRRAMGKKKPEVIAGLRSQFVEGAVKNGVDAKIAGQVFDLMEYFAGYGFNKSHSAAYAVVAYQTAYLKANYPLEYMAALLTSVMGNSDKVALYIEECRRLGIEILPPDVNESGEQFTPVKGKIRFGLAAVKNVGHNPIQNITQERLTAPFSSLQDFCQRVDGRMVNKRVMESLIKAGAMDSFPGNRAQKLAILDLCLDSAQQIQRDRQQGQVSLFDLMTDDTGKSLVNLEVPLPDIDEFNQKDLLGLEKEMLGLYISGHPLNQYRQMLQGEQVTKVLQLAEIQDNSKVTLGGLIVSLKKLFTKKGDEMAFINLEDLTGTVEVVVFPKVWQAYKHLISVDQPVFVRGRLNEQEDESKVLAEDFVDLTKVEDINQLGAKEQKLFLNLTNYDELNQDILDEVKQRLIAFQGSVPVYRCYKRDGKLKTILLPKAMWVTPQPLLMAQLRELLGQENVYMRVG